MINVILGLAAVVAVSWLYLRVPEPVHRFTARFVLGASLFWLVQAGGCMLTTALTPYTAATLRDAWLAWPENQIGIHGPTLGQWLDSTAPALGGVLHGLYRWHRLAAILVALYCASIRDLTPLVRLLVAFVIALALGMPLYLALPAEGPTAHLGLGPDPEWLAAFQALRAGVDLEEFKSGLVCCPSYHTAGAVLIFATFLRTELSGAAAIWSGTMLVATFAYGDHYATDMVVGGTLAVVGCVAADGLVRRWGGR